MAGTGATRLSQPSLASSSWLWHACIHGYGVPIGQPGEPSGSDDSEDAGNHVRDLKRRRVSASAAGLQYRRNAKGLDSEVVDEVSLDTSEGESDSHTEASDLRDDDTSQQGGDSAEAGEWKRPKASRRTWFSEELSSLYPG